MKKYSDEDILQVVAERVKKYTSNESTSLTYNKARQLMGSVLYCMEEGEKDQSASKGNKTDNLAKINSDISALEAFRIGLNKRKFKIKKAEILYKKILENFCYYENECYRDTIISGMEGFFKVYDVEFDATNHILTLDYPLVYEVTRLKGIDLIYEYLYRTLLEQSFLRIFEEEKVVRILLGYHKKHSELIINICKLVLRNAIGCMLINKPIYELNIDAQGRKEIKNICSKYSLAEIETIIFSLLNKLIMEEAQDNIELGKYLEHDIHEFAVELKYCLDNDCIEKLFVEIKEESVSETTFEDGISMEDEQLRKLLEEMRDTILIEDRIELLKKNIKSLADLKEILLECFYDEEYGKVFEMLSNDEINVLQEEIREKVDFNEELYEWEEKLMKYKLDI